MATAECHAQLRRSGIHDSALAARDSACPIQNDACPVLQIKFSRSAPSTRELDWRPRFSRAAPACRCWSSGGPNGSPHREFPASQVCWLERLGSNRQSPRRADSSRQEYPAAAAWSFLGFLGNQTPPWG